MKLLRALCFLPKSFYFFFNRIARYAQSKESRNLSSKIPQITCKAIFRSCLKIVEAMPETTFDEIVDKYVEMNAAHPFMEGNGRSTRIWLDMIFKKRMKMCVDWSKINKKEYLEAMIASHTDSSRIRVLLKEALTNKINDRETFMKGIDYSYYYEQEE